MKKILVLTLVLTILMSSVAFAQGESGSILSCSYGSTYVIKNDGSLWGCGYQYVGNGTGFKDEQVAFVKILDDVKSVSSGGPAGTVAVKKDGSLWGWGYFKGHPTVKGNQSPKELYPTQLDIDDVKSASCTTDYILALKNDNTLWACGEIYIGDGTDTKAFDGFTKIADNIIDMFADRRTVFYLKDDNTLWGYGDNMYAQLGNMAAEKDDLLTPIQILGDVKSICTNYRSSVVGAIRLDNSLYLWGDSGFYTEEYGWIEDAGKPYKSMDNVKMAVLDADEAFVLKTDNTLWRWGDSFESRSASNKQVPYKVADNVLNVSIGERHAAVIKTDNTLWTMGGDYRGGLGYEANETWHTPLTRVLDNVQDAPASWAYETVEKAIGAKLIPEDMQNNYTKAITREEFCILAIRMIEVKSGMSIDEYLAEVGVQIAPSHTFEDCDTKEVRAAKVLGITKGTSKTEFSPNDLLTREQAATFLTNTAMACGRDVTLNTPSYSDVNEIAEWARPYTGYVYDINVMKGVGNNKFGPKAPYQRQQAFMTMYKIWQAIDSVNPDNVEVSKDTSTAASKENLANKKTDEPLGIAEINGFLTYKPYEEDYMALYYGTKTTNDGVEKLQKNIYYKNVKTDAIYIREDLYSNRGYLDSGVIDCINIYYDLADTTFIRMYRSSDYAESVEGNWLEFKYLNPLVFKEMQTDEDVADFEAKIYNEDSNIDIKQTFVDGSTIFITYNANNRMPIYYKRTIPYDGSDKKKPTVIEYELFSMHEDYDILYSIMDEKNIK